MQGRSIEYRRPRPWAEVLVAGALAAVGAVGAGCTSAFNTAPPAPRQSRRAHAAASAAAHACARRPPWAPHVQQQVELLRDVTSPGPASDMLRDVRSPLQVARCRVCAAAAHGASSKILENHRC